MRPAIGEIVTYYVTENDTCLAVVIDRIYWDLAVIELASGHIVRARRVVVEDEEGSRRGRWMLDAAPLGGVSAPP